MDGVRGSWRRWRVCCSVLVPRLRRRPRSQALPGNAYQEAPPRSVALAGAMIKTTRKKDKERKRKRRRVVSTGNPDGEDEKMKDPKTEMANGWTDESQKTEMRIIEEKEATK